MYKRTRTYDFLWQVVRVDEITTVVVDGGGQLTTEPWNGVHGGIMAFLATAVVEVADGGRVHANGLGYRGVPMQNQLLQVNRDTSPRASSLQKPTVVSFSRCVSLSVPSFCSSSLSFCCCG